MKKVIIYPAFAFITLFFISCGDSNEVAVRETCETFIAAILKGDLATAKIMVTPETYKKWGSSTEFLDEVIKERWKSAKTKVSNIEVNGDHAQATLTIGIPSEMEGEVTVLHLQKHGKVWLIHEPGILIKEVLRKETVIMDVEEVK